MGKNVRIIQPPTPQEPVAVEVLATAIRDLAASMKKLTAGPLKRDAIVVLLHERSGIGKRDIEVILNNLEDFDQIWLKEKKK